MFLPVTMPDVEAIHSAVVIDAVGFGSTAVVLRPPFSARCSCSCSQPVLLVPRCKLTTITIDARASCLLHPPFVLSAMMGVFHVTSKVLPIERGGGIDQKLLLDFSRRLAAGGWCHVFPEGKTVQVRSGGGTGDGGRNPPGIVEQLTVSFWLEYLVHSIFFLWKSSIKLRRSSDQEKSFQGLNIYVHKYW